MQLLKETPPIDVFAGMEELLGEEPIGCLPSRAQLEAWVTEHHQIETEAEGFDASDMRELKKFAKGTRRRPRLETCSR